MSQNQPIHILVIILPIVMAVIAAWSPRANTAEMVSQTAGKIADFEMPRGFEPELAVHMLGYDLASYRAGKGESAGHLYLIQSEFDGDREKLEGVLAGYTPDREDWTTRMTLVDTRETEIRGRAATLVFSKGVNSQGEIFAQVVAQFEGKGGPAMLELSEPVASWKMEEVEAFLASIQ
jgi:hypothetical protein